MDWNDVEQKLADLYPDADRSRLLAEIQEVVEEFRGAAGTESVSEKMRFDQSSACLITYANSIAEPGRPTLETLREFLLEIDLTDLTNVVHILPFYPWDTDRGFSVKDYRKIEDDYGSWDDIAKLAGDVELMFDFVANHASIDNPLIQGSLIARHLDADDSRRAEFVDREDFCLAFEKSNPPEDGQLQALARPRPSPVLAPYVVIEREGELRAVLGQPEEFADSATILGEGLVWATFSRPNKPDGSEDTRQIDLNFANPAVLIEVLKILLFYREKGGSLIRLDAIGYLWKKLGSSSIHEPETHLVLELIYQLLSYATPETITIAEVNEPQANAFTYLGEPGHPEADWVYQFTHFPLALHCLRTNDVTEYVRWLPTAAEANGRQFVTTLGTHDGIGMKPVRGILEDSEIDQLVDYLIDHAGGLPNHASLPGGRQIVYEVCTTPWCAINGAEPPEDDAAFELMLDRYLAVISLSFLVRGLPAIYINGIFGTGPYLPESGLEENREINREVFEKDRLFATLDDSSHRHSRVLQAVRELLAARSHHSAFSPNAPGVVVLESGCSSVLAALLPSNEGPDLVQLVNLSSGPAEARLSLPREKTGLAKVRGKGDRQAESGGTELVYPTAAFETAWFEVA
ncbi:MAG: hypothetical protein HKN23_03520 [Verrucomicrobiales bacterium]|nr:hypothetical protein [Verrucomicrobiales bacterium]